jgi:hypothetical protein
MRDGPHHNHQVNGAHVRIVETERTPRIYHWSCDDRGQLEVWPWQDGPLHGGRFDQDTWLASFEQVLQSGPAAGYAQTRFLAQMEWALVDLPGVDDLIEFETRVNYVMPQYTDPVI